MTRSPAYDRGFAHGQAEAAEREHLGDASAGDAETWFAIPAGAAPTDAEAADYERGFHAGWAEHFTARES